MNSGEDRGNGRPVRLVMAALLLAGVLSVFGQTVVENPAAPASKTAGRTITLKEILKITDESGEFFFKYPRILAEGPDGSFYVQDNEQILRFDKDGKFLRNYFKKGQGPGEMTYASALIPSPKGVCIQSTSPPKLISFDAVGKLLEERPIRQKERGSLLLLDIKGEGYVFSGSEFPRFEQGEPQYVDAIQSLLVWTGGEEEPKKIATFPLKVYLVSGSGGGGGMMSIATFMAVPFGPKAFVVIHTSEYLLKIFGLEPGAVIRTFSRKYERVETPPPTAEDKKPRMIINGKEITYPRQKYLNDISKVIAREDKIWVVTSTKDPKKGTLVDVFDAAGRYVDAFNIAIPSPNYAVFGDHLYATERTPDETIVLKKYAIEWRD
jgi:hypothetical protein